MYLGSDFELRLIDTTIRAGKQTLVVYKKNKEVRYKDDKSPVTEADLASNEIISESLLTTEFPILSEEAENIEYGIRRHWKKFWMVDPLDGTKEFINGGSDYTINIAFIKNNQAVYGVVYLPVKDLLYLGDIERGAFRLDKASTILDHVSDDLPFEKLEPGKSLATDSISVVASKSHLNNETREYIDRLGSKYKNVSFKSYGSSMKLCILAEGFADIYPRMGPTMEWDIAAGHAILKAAGGDVISLQDRQTLKYNKPNLLNSYFIAYASSTLNEDDIRELG